MKRTWVVMVGMSEGHELSDSLHATEIYGPFTKEEAQRLEQALNPILDDGETEHLTATAAPLDFRSSVSIIRSYRKDKQCPDLS